jgi:hypothetical protein
MLCADAVVRVASKPRAMSPAIMNRRVGRPMVAPTVPSARYEDGLRRRGYFEAAASACCKPFAPGLLTSLFTLRVSSITLSWVVCRAILRLSDCEDSRFILTTELSDRIDLHQRNRASDLSRRPRPGLQLRCDFRHEVAPRSAGPN